MNTIMRTVYLGYYIKKLKFSEFRRFLNQASKESKKGRFSLIVDAVGSIYKYNIGLMDYFFFRFYTKDIRERAKWVGTGYKYEFDLKADPKSTRKVLQNKLAFYKAYEPFIKHTYCSIDDLRKKNERAQNIIDNSTGRIVVKDSLGQCGWDIEILEAKDYDMEMLYDYMKSKGFNLAEEFIVQHDEINRLSPSGLNTIRTITMVNENGDVDILGTRMRVTVNNYVDNLASGNIACSIDLKTGKINRKGVYKDITKEESVSHHPFTGVQFQGYQIPMWDEIIEKTKEIAAHRPENRSVGWDIALTKNGPDFIEGNHNWCEILWQIPVNQGLKHVLDRYHM